MGHFLVSRLAAGAAGTQTLNGGSGKTSLMSPGKKDAGKLSKAELVKLAVKKVKEHEPGFDPSRFSRVRAFQRGNERRVEFSNPVEFVPRDTCAYYSASVYLGELESVSCDEASNPDGFECDEPRFYQPSADDEKAAAEVLRTMELPPARDIGPDETITIYDRESHYEVIQRTKYGVAHFKLDKKSKHFEETMHKDLAQHDEGSFTEMEK